MMPLLSDSTSYVVLGAITAFGLWTASADAQSAQSPLNESIMCPGFEWSEADLVPSDRRSRVAIVVGNSDYRSLPRLQNPRNDAVAVGEALRRFGFIVACLQDATAEDIRTTVLSLATNVPLGSQFLFFYAGHGGAVSGRNYLTGVDTSVLSSDAFTLTSVGLIDIVNILTGSGAATTMVIVDACRSPIILMSPGDERASSSVKGFAPVHYVRKRDKKDRVNGLFVGFSTDWNNIASDNPAGSNSLFTATLLRKLGARGVTLEDTFDQVSVALLYNDNNKYSQRPQRQSIGTAGKFVISPPPIDWEHIDDEIPILEAYLRLPVKHCSHFSTFIWSYAEYEQDPRIAEVLSIADDAMQECESKPDILVAELGYEMFTIQGQEWSPAIDGATPFTGEELILPSAVGIGPVFVGEEDVARVSSNYEMARAEEQMGEIVRISWDGSELELTEDVREELWPLAAALSSEDSAHLEVMTVEQPASETGEYRARRLALARSYLLILELVEAGVPLERMAVGYTTGASESDDEGIGRQTTLMQLVRAGDP